MIPICLVTGFLGSGKTTLLQQFVNQFKDKSYLYLVNEFSSVDVDGTRLALPENQLLTVAGGSIFCKCKVTDFINNLKLIVETYSDIEGVIIEASGIADPGVTAKMLQETRLDQHYKLHRVVCIADPGTLPKLLKTLPNTRKQLEAADNILLNKCDLYPENEIEDATTLIKEHSPDSQIDETSYCQCRLDIFAPVNNVGKLTGDYAKCKDPNFAESHYLGSGKINLEKLQKDIEAAGTVYRCKGILQTVDGFFSIDYSPAGWENRPATTQGQNELVLIVSGSNHLEAVEITRNLKSGKYYY